MHSNGKPGVQVQRNKEEDLSFMNLEGAAVNEESVSGNGCFEV